MNKEQLNEVKKLINDYFEKEYDETLNNETFYDNLEDFGLAYTVDEWDEEDEDKVNEIQVSTNILDMSLQTYIDGELLENYKFRNYEDYKEFLTHLDFDNMIWDAHDVYRGWKEMMA